MLPLLVSHHFTTGCQRARIDSGVELKLGQEVEAGPPEGRATDHQKRESLANKR